MSEVREIGAEVREWQIMYCPSGSFYGLWLLLQLRWRPLQGFEDRRDMSCVNV